jgi:hypothetical protein
MPRPAFIEIDGKSYLWRIGVNPTAEAPKRPIVTGQ